MKFKMSKRILAAALAVVLTAGLAAYAVVGSSEPTVIFDAATKQFTFKNVDFTTTTDANGGKSQNIYPDLFPDMKNMMPGDRLTQNIKFVVKNTGSKTVKLMLRAEDPEGQPPVDLQEEGWSAAPAADENTEAADPTNSDYDKLFTKTKEVPYPAELTVKVADSDEVYTGTLVSTLPADAATAPGGVYLGGFKGKESSKDVTVDFALPIEAGNELQGLTAKLGWVITAQIIDGGGGGGGEIIPDEPVPGADLNMTDHYAYIIGRDDGLVHPEASITRGEVATIFFRMLTDESRTALWSQTNAYADVAPNMWYNAAISTMSNGGIIKGYPDGTFRPNAPITRAEFAAMAARFFDEECEVKDVFSDVAGHWAEESINRAAAVGIINGYPDGTFGPDRSITRAEAITIFNNVLGRAPVKDHLLDEMIKWPDNMDTAAWYYADMQEATNSHDYDMEMSDDGVTYEVWTELLPVRDWAAFEREWANSNAASNPGEVISSANATK